jgi:hypothetical protein
MGDVRRAWVLIIALAAGVTGLLTSTAAAAVTLGPVETLSAQGSYNPNVSVSANGTMLATWGAGRSGHAIARFRRPGNAKWSGAQVVIPRGVLRLQAIGADGTAAIVWLVGEVDSPKHSNLLVSIAPPGGRFGRPRVVASGKWLDDPLAVVRPDGDVVLVWTRSLSLQEQNPVEVLYSGARAGGAPSAPRRVGLGGPSRPTIAENDAGAILLTYGTSFGEGKGSINRQAVVATMPAATAQFGTPIEFRADQRATFPQPGAEDDAEAVAGDGRVALVNRPSATLPARIVETRALADDGVLGPPVVATVASRTGTAQTEEVRGGSALGGDGALIETSWEEEFAGEYGGPLASSSVRTAVTLPGAMAMSPPQDVVRAAHVSLFIPEATSVGGDVVAIWTRTTGKRFCTERVYFTDRSAGGAFSTPRALSGPFHVCGARETDLAGGGAQALAAWIENSRIVVRRIRA